MNRSATHTWPELAIGLYDQLTERNAAISYDFHNLEVDIPDSTGAEAERAHWRINGGIRVSTHSAAVQ